MTYSTLWLVLWRRAGARARAYPSTGQRLHTVTQAPPRARARAHVSTSAHTRAREHLAVVRLPRPNSANTEVQTKSINGDKEIGPNQMVKKFLKRSVEIVHASSSYGSDI